MGYVYGSYNGNQFVPRMDKTPKELQRGNGKLLLMKRFFPQLFA